jgi:hypothetical protein
MAAALTSLALAACSADSPAASTAPSSTRAARSTSSAQSSSTTPSAPAPTTATATATVTTSAPSPAPATALASTRLTPVPLAGAEPRTRFPTNQAAVGSGANASAHPVSDAVWARMVGYSWTSGCPVGRSSLRYITVNFWGFDGHRSRGAIVVNASIASRTVAAFTRLYEQRFRIRQMKVMDSSWGHAPIGPGADDYTAMDADNTSGFNCRYVGGEESKKGWSNHAYGTAIDVNDFENPYIAGPGRIYPDAWFATRRSGYAGAFSSTRSTAVRAFTDQGFRWGGVWSAPDFQHFDVGR